MAKKDIQLYLHIPFGSQKTLCSTKLMISGNPTVASQYLDALEREVLGAGDILKDYTIRTIYFGGTATLLPAARITGLLDRIRENFDVAGDVEVTVEAEPQTLSGADGAALRDGGVNRLSVEMQTASPRLSRYLGTAYDFQQVQDCVLALKAQDIRNINLDVLYGIPGQTPGHVETLLSSIRTLSPAHVSLFPMPVNPMMGERVSKGTRRLLYSQIAEGFKEQGYRQYSLYHFAREGYDCTYHTLHFGGTDRLGLGLGATSYLDGLSCSNTADIRLYLSASGDLKELRAGVMELGEEERMKNFTALGLHRVEGFTGAEFEARFGSPLPPFLAETLAALEEQGLIAGTEGRYTMTIDGVIDAEEVFAALFPEQEQEAEEKEKE